MIIRMKTITDNEDESNLFDCYKALSVHQPYADLLVTPVGKDAEGKYFAEKQIEVRKRATKHRGDLLICASAKPEIPLHKSGCCVGLVELYGVKRVSEFTEEDWKKTCIPEGERDRFKDGFGLLMRNPRRVVEMPVKGRLGFFKVMVSKGDITEYPRQMVIGEEGWKLIQRKLQSPKK